MQIHGGEGREDGMRQEGKDSLQSEVIHSHPGVVNVKKDLVEVHICTNNLEGRGQMLIRQLSLQSDTQIGKKYLCFNTFQNIFVTLTSAAGATQRSLLSATKRVPLYNISTGWCLCCQFWFTNIHQKCNTLLERIIK